MSFNNTRTPTLAEVNPTGKPAKYQITKAPGKNGSMEYRLEGEIREKFIELFPIRSNREMMKLFGVSFATIQRLKRELGLQKDMAVIKHRQAMDIKRKCEKNGWYDSQRGHPPSEACLQGAKAYRESDRYKHPLLIMKEQHPRLYARRMKEKTEQRRKTMAKERRRVDLCLTQHTKLHLPYVKYTRSQVCYRRRMKLHGYILGSIYEGDGERYVIYYDQNTQRSLLAEANAPNYKMEILPLPDDEAQAPIKFKAYNNRESLNTVFL